MAKIFKNTTNSTISKLRNTSQIALNFDICPMTFCCNLQKKNTTCSSRWQLHPCTNRQTTQYT